MNETDQPIVEVTGALTGRFEFLEQHEDDTGLLAPDTSAETILRRLGSRPATAEEFQQAFGDVRPCLRSSAGLWS